MAFCQWQEKKVWIWRAIDGITRQPLGWQCGHRGDSTLKRLLAKLKTQTCTFITDEWQGFFRLLPEDRHFYGKDLTFPIEQTNSDLRHRLARFVRRSKCTSRSLDMVEASLTLYHHLQSKNNLQDLFNIFLSSFS